MDADELRDAMGHRVRIEAGIEGSEGVLTNARPYTMSVGAWGADLEVPTGDWVLTIDGHTREWPGASELTILD